MLSCTANARSNLAISYVPIESLKADARNARVHTKKQVRQIASSIESFGFNVLEPLHHKAITQSRSPSLSFLFLFILTRANEDERCRTLKVTKEIIIPWSEVQILPVLPVLSTT